VGINLFSVEEGVLLSGWGEFFLPTGKRYFADNFMLRSGAHRSNTSDWPMEIYQQLGIDRQ